MKKVVFLSVLVALAAFGWFDAGAQCVMCKAVAESSQRNAEQGIGVNNASGSINSGILYLMGTVYFVLMALVFIFFREQIAARWANFRGTAVEE